MVNYFKPFASHVPKKLSEEFSKYLINSIYCEAQGTQYLNCVL